MCPYLYLSVSPLCVEEQTNVNRGAVASIRAARVERHRQWKVMREEKQAGRWASWILMSPLPPRAWREDRSGHLSAACWDEMVCSAVQLQLCSLSSISGRNMWMERKEKSMVHCLISYGGWIFDGCKWMYEEMKGFNETEWKWDSHH